MAGLFIYALVTKDVMQSLLMGTFSMYILWYKFGSIIAFFRDCKVVLADEENIEMYMSFFLCGGLIIAMKRSGATKAFSKKRFKSSYNAWCWSDCQSMLSCDHDKSETY